MALVFALTSGGLACGAAADHSPSGTEGPVATHDGLTIVEANESAGKLVAKFRKNGREITFDLRLGPEMENAAAASMGSSFEVDARVLDAAGRPFYMQMAGDEFIDATWRVPVVDKVDAAGRLADVETAREAASAFASLALPASLAPLRDGAADIARSFADWNDRGEKVGAVQGTTASGGGIIGSKSLPPPEEPPEEIPTEVDVAGTSSIRYWDYRVYHKPTSGQVGEHSAVMLRGFDGNYAVIYKGISCNHGTCAGNSAMTGYCEYSSYFVDDGTHTRRFYGEPSTVTGTISGGCSTPYGLLSGVGTHNCNDDSQLQVHAISFNSTMSRTSGVCGDSGFLGTSPRCQ